MSDEKGNLKHVVIYADGAAEPNPGPGGYGVVLLYGGHRKELSAGFRRTTNNRMELMGPIAGLQSLKALCRVTLYSDSKYVVEAMKNGTPREWRDKDWQRGRVEVPNADLWKNLLELCELHAVQFVWVKGHAGNVENERCDVLSVLALQGANLPADEGYEERESDENIRERPFFAVPTMTASRTKITAEGQPCRKCGTAVEKRTPRRRPKAGQAYYFEYYLHCPKCQTMYMVEAAKRNIGE